MRSFRNPRYAPEFLEKKLSPAGISPGFAASALVYTPTPADSSSTDLQQFDPPDDPGLPPYMIPSVPTGPVGPA